MKLSKLIFVALLTLSLGFSGCQRKYAQVPQKVISPISVAPLVFSSYVRSLINQAEITSQEDVDAIYSIYNTEKNQLPQKGENAELNSPALASAFVIAGQVCEALKNKEMSLQPPQRRAFRFLNFSPTAQDLSWQVLASDSAINSLGDSLTQMFLGRSATPSEKTLFMEARNQILAGEPITSRNNSQIVRQLAVSVCTAVASSVEALTI